MVMGVVFLITDNPLSMAIKQQMCQSMRELKTPIFESG
jgi:hypothetical protein